MKTFIISLLMLLTVLSLGQNENCAVLKQTGDFQSSATMGVLVFGFNIPYYNDKRNHLQLFSRSDDVDIGDDDDDDDDNDEDHYELYGDSNIIDNYEQKRQKLLSSSTMMYSYGLNRGRSSPNQRKAIGTSSTEQTLIHVCTNCGSESIKWYGQCPTCREWNTIQPMKVQRANTSSSSPFGTNSSANRPTFASNRDIVERKGRRSSRQGNTFPFEGDKEEEEYEHFMDDDQGSSRFGRTKRSSWLGGDQFEAYSANTPRPISEIHDQMKLDHKRCNSNKINNANDDDDDNLFYDLTQLERRLIVPNHPELNRVLGGGIMPGSLTLLGGDPGVGKSTLLLQIAASVSNLCTSSNNAKPGIGMGSNSSDDDSKTATTTNNNVGPAWYVSGEENSWQIAARAARLGLDRDTGITSKNKRALDQLMLICDTDADYVADLISNSYYQESPSLSQNQQQHYPSLIVIDSIQTMLCEAGGNSSPGGITQVRENVNLFLRLAKSTGIPIIMIGHVTKTGDVAGPRTVEHMVDCVLYLEHGGDSGSSTGSDSGTSGSISSSNIRLLRASKNRFGSSDEIGVYQVIQELDHDSNNDNNANGSNLGGGALVSVIDPSSLFLQSRIDDRDLEGCAVSIIVEGTRCMAAEVQALVSPSSSSSGGGNSYKRSSGGRRTVDGVSLSRVLLILAVLEKRYNLWGFKHHDVYINVVGGIRLGGSNSRGRASSNGNNKDASDLAVAVSLVSSLVDIEVRSDTAFVGEIGLVGELRPTVSSLGKRIREAQRMGFSRIVIPASPKKNIKATNTKKQNKSSSSTSSYMIDNIQVIECDTLLNAINEGLVRKIYPDAFFNKKQKRNNKQRNSYWNDDEDDYVVQDDDDYYSDDDDDESFYKNEQNDELISSLNRKKRTKKFNNNNNNNNNLSSLLRAQKRKRLDQTKKEEGPWRDVEELIRNDGQSNDSTSAAKKKKRDNDNNDNDTDSSNDEGFQ